MTLTTEQKQARQKGIGGSDVSALLGISKYKTPVQLWAEKRGELEPEEPKNAEAVHFGHVLENIVAEEFSRRTGIKVRRDRLHYAHKEHEFMLANIDRRCIAHEIRSALECKTGSYFTGRDWGETGTDEVPLWYMAQAAHYMAVLGLERMYVAVLIGGQDFRHYHIDRDEKMIENLIKKEAEFWDMVKTGTTPEPINEDDLKLLYPEDKGTPYMATPEDVTVLEAIAAKKAQAKQLNADVKALELQIKKRMGDDADILLGADGDKIATWRSHEQSSFDIKGLWKHHPEIADTFSGKRTVRPFRIS